MTHPDVTIVKLQEELKEAHRNITYLLKERDVVKKAYSMQIDLVEALEQKINKLQMSKCSL